MTDTTPEPSPDRTTMTCLLHGESGNGKSWLSASAPKPLLIVDIEGRAKHVAESITGPKVTWDPLIGAPPAYDGTWHTCIVNAHSYGVLDTVYQWLRSGQHPFKSVAIDSLMEAQKRWMDSNVGATDPLKTQDWGAVLRALEKFVRDMRDIVNYDVAHVDVVVIVCGSVPDDRGRARPLLQGQLKNTLPYFLDVVGWLYVVPDPVDNTKMNRVLNVGPTPWAVAKDGTGRLGGPEINVSNDSGVNLWTLYQRLEEGATA